MHILLTCHLPCFPLLLPQWQMQACKLPFSDVHPGQLCMGVVAGSLQLEWPADTHPLLRELGASCLAADRRLRPTFQQAAELLGVIEAIVRCEPPKSSYNGISPVAACFTGQSSQQ